MIGTRLAQRYELVSVLGRGGMGAVYLARDPHLDREVAVKVLSLADLGESSEERFLREAQIVAKMDHPSIVPIYDLGRDGDQLFFVMPVVRGETLHELTKRASLSLGDILEMAAQVAEALDYSHQLGVIHRDIKPENIMISREDNLRVRVMDFGLALGHAASRLTRTGTLPGTLGYLSPEQILAVEVDGRADLYSLATILYECLVGKPPFSGARYALLYQIVNEAPPPLANHGVDRGLERLVLDCLSKNPQDRPARGNDLALLLRQQADLLTHGGLRRDVSVYHVEPELPEKAAPAPLVGRDREIGELRYRLELAASGECQLVLIGGDPGMGKTRLIEELERLARARGFRVLRGRFSDQESAFPFQAFGELIQDFYLSKELASSSASFVPDLSDLEEDLRAVFPALAEVKMWSGPQERGRSSAEALSRVASSRLSSSRLSSSWVPSSWDSEEPDREEAGERTRDARERGKKSPDHESRQDAARPDREGSGTRIGSGLALAAARRGDPTHFFEILARALTRLAAGRPTVYLLENLHGAEISIEALQYMVRRLGPTSSLFAATYVTSETPRHHPLSRLVKSVRDEPRFSSVVLGPLAIEELRELLSSRLGEGEVSTGLCEKLFESTEGNPFFALELIRSLIDSGDVSRDSGGAWILSAETAIVPGSLPETIQQAVESRLEGLPEDLLEILQMASVLGRTFDYEDLEALVGEDVDEEVETLLRDGLLLEDHQARSDLLHFASGVVRDVLHGQLTRRRRRGLHRRHARNLEQRFSGRLRQVYPQLVDHYAAADVAGKTVDYALRLARHSIDAVGASAAILALRTALEFIEDEELGPEKEGELRFLLASALRSVGSNEAAVREAARSVRLYEEQKRAVAAASAALLAAETSWQGRRVGETRRWVEKGIDLARSAGSKEDLKKLLTLGATVANLRGEYQKARLRWEEAQKLGTAELPARDPLPSGGKLTASVEVTLSDLDPRRALTVEESEILANIFEPLIESDAEGHLNPCLAEDWEKTPDHLSFLVHLRKEVRFSDATPLRAEDVKRSFTSIKRPRLPTACLALRGAEEHFSRQSSDWPGIEIVDEHTVRFLLREPLPIFPILLTDLSVAVYRRDGEGRLVGTGPFRFGESRHDSLRLFSNEQYWRGNPPLVDELELRTFDDSASAALSLRSGELDVGRDFRPEELDHLLRDPRFRSGLVEATRQNVYLIALNAAGPKTCDPELRRALVDVIRVQDAVWQALGRFAQPASCLVPPGILGHEPGRRRAHLSPHDARELVEASSGERPVVLNAVAHPLFFDRYRSFTDILLRGFKEVGVEVAFKTASREAYLEKTQDGSGIDLWLGRWVADYDDPDVFTFGLLDSRRGFLGSYMASEEIDRITAEARQAERPAARLMLYRRLEDLLDEKRLLLPLFYDVDYRLVGPQVRGLKLLRRPPYVSYSRVAKGSGQKEVQKNRDSGLIHVPLPHVYGDLAPRQGQILGGVEMLGNVFETLTRLDEGARIVPNLVSEFRLEDGGRRFRFKLRSNVRFHDGRKLTVRDVRYTFEELIRGLSDDALEADLVPICGGRAYWEGAASELEGFRILSAQEFLIELERPLSFFPTMLTSSSTAIVPEGAKSFDGNWRDGTVGTGPFRVLRFAAGERLELEAHPHYWRRGLPKCDRLVFELGIERSQILSEIRAGRLGLASNLRPAEVDELLSAPEFAARYLEMPGFATAYLILNTRKGALRDRGLLDQLRRLIAESSLVRTTLGRLAAPAQGLIPPGLLGHEAQELRITAEREVSSSSAEALSGLKLKASIFPAFSGPYDPFWQGLTETLGKSGISLSTTTESPVDTLWRIVRSEVDIAAVRWAASYPDPDALIHFFHSRGYLGELVGGPELDELFDRGRGETDPALRQTIYRQIDQYLSHHEAVIPLFHEQVYRFAHPDLEGLRLRFGWPEVAYEELSLTP